MLTGSGFVSSLPSTAFIFIVSFSPLFEVKGRSFDSALFFCLIFPFSLLF